MERAPSKADQLLAGTTKCRLTLQKVPKEPCRVNNTFPRASRLSRALFPVISAAPRSPGVSTCTRCGPSSRALGEAKPERPRGMEVTFPPPGPAGGTKMVQVRSQNHGLHG